MMWQSGRCSCACAAKRIISTAPMAKFGAWKHGDARRRSGALHVLAGAVREAAGAEHHVCAGRDRRLAGGRRELGNREVDHHVRRVLGERPRQVESEAGRDPGDQVDVRLGVEHGRQRGSHLAGGAGEDDADHRG